MCQKCVEAFCLHRYSSSRILIIKSNKRPSQSAISKLLTMTQQSCDPSDLPSYYEDEGEAVEIAINLLFLLERSNIPFADDVRTNMLEEIQRIRSCVFF